MVERMEPLPVSPVRRRNPYQLLYLPNVTGMPSEQVQR